MVFKRREMQRSYSEVLFAVDKVDLVARVDANTVVELHVIVDIPWTGSDDQLRSLQAKVYSYLDFIANGQMVALYPDTEGLPWRVVVNCRTGEPDERSAQMLALLGGYVGEEGGEFELRAPVVS